MKNKTPKIRKTDIKTLLKMLAMIAFISTGIFMLAKLCILP